MLLLLFFEKRAGGDARMDGWMDGYKKFWWGRFLRSVKGGALTDGVGGVNLCRSWLKRDLVVSRTVSINLSSLLTLFFPFFLTENRTLAAEFFYSEREMDKIEHLRKEIAQREAELADLRARLAAEEELRCTAGETQNGEEWKWPLDEHDYQRYSRQMIVPNFGLQGIFFFFFFSNSLS